MKIVDGAVARLVMIKGSLVEEAGLRDIIDEYRYIPHSDDPYAYNLMDHQGFISFEQQGDVVNIYGDGETDITEHAGNLDRILKRAGWGECDISVTNSEVYNHIMSRFGMDVRDITVDGVLMNASGERRMRVEKPVANDPAAVHESKAIHEVATTLSSAARFDDTNSLTTNPDDMLMADPELLEAHARIQELDNELITVQGENERLASDLAAANETIRQLKIPGKLASATNLASSSFSVNEQPVSALQTIVENHIGKLIDIDASCAGSSLVRELRDAGYQVQVRLGIPVA